MKLDIGLAERERAAVSTILNALLSDEVVLTTKTRNFHWNVKGMPFNDLHKFFDAQYEELNGIVDVVAERVRSLGRQALGTLAEFQKQARLKEQPGLYPEARSMIAALLSDHESLIRALRADASTVLEKHGDAGTNDLLTGLLQQHEKMAWMLRSYLEG